MTPRSSRITPLAVHAQSSAVAVIANMVSGTGLTRIVSLPRRHVVDHQHDPDHRAADQQQSAEVIPRAPQQRRIEGVEYRCTAGEDDDDGHQGADQANDKADPRGRHASNGTTQARRRHGIAETHGKERRDHIGHRRPVQRHRGVIGIRVVERRRQRAAHQHLPCAQHHGWQKDAKGDPIVIQGQTTTVLHSSSFQARPIAETALWGEH